MQYGATFGLFGKQSESDHEEEHERAFLRERLKPLHLSGLLTTQHKVSFEASSRNVGAAQSLSGHFVPGGTAYNL